MCTTHDSTVTRSNSSVGHNGEAGERGVRCAAAASGSVNRRRQRTFVGDGLLDTKEGAPSAEGKWPAAELAMPFRLETLKARR
jgi:hypothetical protein